MIQLKDIASKLKNAKSVAVFTHVRPDGDTLGSAFALKEGLISLGKTADVFVNGQVPDTFINLEPLFNSGKKELDENYEVYISVDVSDRTRLGVFAEAFGKKKGTLLVDHHISNDCFADFSYVEDCAADCEIIYELLNLLEVKFTPLIANLVLTGIVTDTGAFAHKNVTAKSLSIASSLLSFGADLNKIIFHMFKSQTKERAKLYAKTMEHIRYYLDGTLGVIAVTKENLKDCNATPEMTEGFIDFVMSVDSVQVGICLLQTGDKTFKVSFRSKGADVNKMAQVYGGGGHTLASGCMVNGYLEDVIDRLVYTVSQWT